MLKPEKKYDWAETPREAEFVLNHLRQIPKTRFGVTPEMISRHVVRQDRRNGETAVQAEYRRDYRARKKCGPRCRITERKLAVIAQVCLQAASRITGWSMATLHSRRRDKNVVWARWCAFFVMEQLHLTDNLSAVARAFRVDRYTLINAAANMPPQIKRSHQEMEILEKISAAVRERGVAKSKPQT